MNKVDIIEEQVVYSDCGLHRIVLYNVEENEFATWFDSIQWQVKEKNEWHVKRAYTEETFAKSLAGDVFVLKIYDFMPSLNRVTLLLSSRGPTVNDNEIDIHTWREWDLMNDREYRFISIASNPFEKSPHDSYKEHWEAIEAKRTSRER